MEKKRITLEVELLEDRIAPGFVAPGLFGPAGATGPPGESLENAIFRAGQGSTAGSLWFGAAASGAGPHTC